MRLIWKPVCKLNSSLRRRFVFMGVLNAVFAPFIVVYLLVYSFFRYFEVGSWPQNLQNLQAGVSQEPVLHRQQAVYPICAMEVPRIQRATTLVRAQTRP